MIPMGKNCFLLIVTSGKYHFGEITDCLTNKADSLTAIGFVFNVRLILEFLIFCSLSFNFRKLRGGIAFLNQRNGFCK
jgi:hypothetical protein